MLLDELGVLEVLLGEPGGELGDEDPRDCEAGEEGPVAAPLPAEEDGPRVEGLHLRSLLPLDSVRESAPLSLLRCVASFVAAGDYGKREKREW